MIKLINKTKVAFATGLIALSLSTFTTSCCSNNSAPDIKYIKDFHNTYFTKSINAIESNNLALYVDYSTCIKDGQHSNFFQSLTPSFVDATKAYYSIKGSTIQKEEAIDIYTELRNIVEVNYADLKSAANQIANADNEAVLLTDGEYFQKNIAKGNISNPYMAESFKTWLKKGHDIYIIAEPYKEKNHGVVYQKKRFYFVFTDNRLEGNIYDRIRETVSLEDFPEISIFHLSADHPSIMAKGKSMEVNQILSASVTPCGNYEIQDWSISWDAIENIILSGVDPNTGEALPDGECVIGGLKVDRNSYGGFRITDIDVKVYDISPYYFSFYNEKEYPSGLPLEEFELYQSPNSIKYDKIEFEKHGIVNLHFDVNMWNPDFLTSSPFNYTKVDICVSSCKNVFNNFTSMFNFDAIGLPGQSNISVTESVKQCLFDPEIQKMMNSATLYSIYIKSNKY